MPDNKQKRNVDDSDTGNQKNQQGQEARQTKSAEGGMRQRQDEPLSDRGRGDRTFEPPAGEQGISNRADDMDEDNMENEGGQKTGQGQSQKGPAQSQKGPADQKGPAEKSDRAAGGNAGSKGQNVGQNRESDRGAGKKHVN